MNRTHYVVSELREGYWKIDITKDDGSRHLVAGFKTREEADAWVEKRRAQDSAAA